MEKRITGAITKKSFWFALLSFVFPIAGFILYLIYEDRKPARARSLIVGFITGIIIKLLLIVILSVFAGVAINQTLSSSDLLFDSLL